MAQFGGSSKQKKAVGKQAAEGAAAVARKLFKKRPPAKPKVKPTSTTDGGVNTNKDSLGQKFLRSHEQLSDRAKERMTPEEIKADRHRRARVKMVDMTPAQKKAELTRLRKKRADKKRAEMKAKKN